MSDELQPWALETLAIRAGHTRTSEGEHAEAIFPTSSFVFSSAAEAAARFAGDEPGNIYSRMTNPTVRYFEERLAAMEGGECCVATSSGMSAILAIMLGLLKSGDHVVCSNSVFGTTTVLLQNYIEKFGVTVSFVKLSDLDAWEQAIQPNTRLCFAETPSNPLTELVNIRDLATLAHRHNSLLVIDNCFCTPVLQRPLALGADMVMHSATKYLDGQGRAMGGAVVGDQELVGKTIQGVLRSCGMSLSPFNAWIFLKGLETLTIRMQAHCSQAMQLAHWLQAQPEAELVHFPGLTTHPQHQLAQAQQSGFGGIVSFVVRGGREAAWRVIDHTRLLSITANLGDTRSTITHPASTTHSRLMPEQREAAGIEEGLLRVSVGLENIQDIQNDLQRGIKKGC